MEQDVFYCATLPKTHTRTKQSNTPKSNSISRSSLSILSLFLLSLSVLHSLFRTRGNILSCGVTSHLGLLLWRRQAVQCVKAQLDLGVLQIVQVLVRLGDLAWIHGHVAIRWRSVV